MNVKFFQAVNALLSGICVIVGIGFLGSQHTSTIGAFFTLLGIVTAVGLLIPEVDPA